MTTGTITAPANIRANERPIAHRAMLAAAPASAVVAGLAAEWLDFRALRYPLLAMVLAGVTATAFALSTSSRADTLRTSLIAIATGIATWAAAETLYVGIHTLRGEPFEAERFGPQGAQALGLIAVHALVLGAPTGVVAAGLLWLRTRLWGRA